MLYNNVLLFVLMLTVLLGTLYPLLTQALGMNKLSVGAPYFNIVFVPPSILLLFLMGFGPLAQWKSTAPKKLAQRTAPALIISVIAGIILLWFFSKEIHLLALIFLTLSLWIILTTMQEALAKADLSRRFFFIRMSRTQYGKTLAHIGVGICVIGIAASSFYSTQREVAMKVGDSVKLGPYVFKFIDLNGLKGANYGGVRAEISVSKAGNFQKILHPEIRTYQADKISLAKAVVDVGIFRDLYVTLGRPLSSGAWTVRVYYKPFIRWIWWGGFLMALGALLAATDKRYRRLKKQGIVS